MHENNTPTPRQRHRSNSTGPNPSSPYVYDIRPLGRRAGSQRALRRDVPAPAELGFDLIRVPKDASLTLDVRFESVTEGVLVTGTVTAPLEGECGRCLDRFTDELVVQLCDLFAYRDSVTDETSDEEEIYRIENDYLDLEPVVRDLVVLALPMTPLCRPDCAGLCPTCGQRLDDLPDGHSHETYDPRWAALARLTAPKTEDQE